MSLVVPPSGAGNPANGSNIRYLAISPRIASRLRFQSPLWDPTMVLSITKIIQPAEPLVLLEAKGTLPCQ